LNFLFDVVLFLIVIYVLITVHAVDISSGIFDVSGYLVLCVSDRLTAFVEQVGGRPKCFGQILKFSNALTEAAVRRPSSSAGPHRCTIEHHSLLMLSSF
jgi:hypothetical protein